MPNTWMEVHGIKFFVTFRAVDGGVKATVGQLPQVAVTCLTETEAKAKVKGAIVEALRKWLAGIKPETPPKSTKQKLGKHHGGGGGAVPPKPEDDK